MRAEFERKGTWEMSTRISGIMDKKLIRQLWEDSLSYTDRFMDWYFERAYYPEDTLIEEAGSMVFSSTTIMPQKLNISGFEASCAYICGEAVPPEYRREPDERARLGGVLNEVAQRNCLLSIVVPSSYKFYEKYGWRTAYSYKQYSIKPSDLPAYEVRGPITRVKAVSEKTISDMNDIYMNYMSDKNAYALRSPKMWSLILEDLQQNFGGKCIIVKNTRGENVGYMLYVVRDRRMGVYEFAYKTRDAYESIMGFIRAHENQIDSVEIKAPANDLSHLDFCDRRDAVRYCPFAMARITDAEKALSIASAKLEDSFNIQIVDRQLERNNGSFKLAGAETEETDEAADVITDIGTLTQLFMGYIDAGEAKRLNLVRGDENLLKKIFDKKNNYINMLLI